MPKSLQELRAHENEISKLRKVVFNGLNQMIVVGMHHKKCWLEQHDVI